jgi:hypothetical protein
MNTEPHRPSQTNDTTPREWEIPAPAQHADHGNRQARRDRRFRLAMLLAGEPRSKHPKITSERPRQSRAEKKRSVPKKNKRREPRTQPDKDSQ